MSREIKDKAKEYLKAHLSVIPTKEDKLPALSTWKPYQSQRMKDDEVEALFSGANVKGIAIICGAISGNLEVIDVDCKYDVSGELWVNIKNLIKLEDITSEVYNSLLIAKTVNNGYHIIYRCDEIEGNQRLAFSVEGDCIIETRGEGGYIIAHPSTGYEFIQGTIEEIPTINPLQRKKLLEIAESLSYVEPTIEEEEGVKLEVTTGLSCWDDYNQKMTTDDVLNLLKAHNWSEVKKDRQGRVYVLRPENVEPSTAKYSGNISRIKKGETEISLFSVFTDNGAPFTENVMLDGKPVKNKNGKFKKQAYTPFAVYTLLEHKGDYSKSAKELYRLGYGDRLSEKEEVNTTNIKVEIVNRVTGETLVISGIGESLKKSEVNSATGEEVVITSPGLEAQEEVLKAIALIQQTGKRIYIKEGDTEVREHRYQLRAIINKYGTIQEESGELTDRDMHSFLDEVVILSSKLNPIDRDIFKTDFLGQEAIKELGISEESLSITVDRLTSTRDKEAQAKDLKKLLSEATQLHDKGEVNKALELLDSTVKDVKLKDKKSSFNKLLEIPTEEDIKLHFSQHSESLRSGFYVNNEELLLPSGGLTGIAGATGHGKTDFLINLTLNAVLNYPDKEFYFFTYEMSQEAILVRFLNTYLDIDLESYSNQRAIKTYFKTGSTQYIKTEAKDIFTAKVKEFFKDIIGSGRLRVKGIDYTAPELNLALSELSKKANVGGFFIDYFQLLNIPKEGYKNYSRQEELKVICQDLNNTAKQLQLPIILGAQFNREVTTPFKLHPTNISEAGDIERILDTLIGIWFTNKKIVAKDLTKAEENDFKNKGLDTPDKLYTYVLKSRETPTDVYELLDYNGKRGKIKTVIALVVAIFNKHSKHINMSKVISISNHKGGVGKTTSAINIGAGLNKLGKKILLIDLDPQANLSQSLGIIEPDSNIYGALRGEYKLQPIEIVKGLDVIPSTLDLSGAEVEMSGEAGREYILRELIEPIRGSYDYILIDSPPSLGLLTLNSFVASDQIFIPLQAQFLALQGLTKLLEVIDKIKKRLNKELEVGGVFITQYDSRKVLNRDVVATIEAHFEDAVFKTKIRDNVALAEAPAQGLDIFRYNPKSPGAEDYLSLCKEILKIK